MKQYTLPYCDPPGCMTCLPRPWLWIVCWLLSCCWAACPAADLRGLFLGDNGPHQPRLRFAQLQPVLAARGIELVYTDEMRDLNPQTLAKYDVLVLYANIDRISEGQSQALLAYVADGHGFVPLHCATYCFRNSPEVVALMGGQFKRHGTGVFRTEIDRPEHPIMRGFGGFESWDETYVHHLHNERNRTVLAFRVDNQGREPWTWIRTHGKGRVFYTAWGHDQRTWSQPGFQNLVERGIRWSAGGDPAEAGDYLADRPFPVPRMTARRTDLKPFAFVDVGKKIPNYTQSNKWGTQGEPLSRMQKPLAPAESLKHLVVPQGFHAELFVAEPQLGGKPLAMTWDERGRLWVAETYDYPNALQPPGKGRDRIRICEDTDGDWVADRFTVFAEGLSIPSSMAFHRGGLIVQNGTETLYLRDSDGDDRADVRRVLISNWSMGDTHGGVSNFQYGLDNWIWAMQGYNNSQPMLNGRHQQAFRMGFFRFRPDGSELEFMRSTNNNTWGLGISEEGIIFGSMANRNPSVYLPIANRYYERVRGWKPSLTLGTIADTFLFKPITDNVRQVDQFGGYTAGAGHALYTARRYPQAYWNRTAFVNGPTGHLVGTFVLRPRGSDFRSTSPFNLVASDDEWSAPIMSEVGPDGNVWVLDWYNYIVQHNPTPHGFERGKGNAYATDLRDKKHGRIYRIVYDSDQPPQSYSLRGATPQKLVTTLGHPTRLWRRQAQRLLVERGQRDVVPALIQATADTHVDQVNLNVGAIHALWTLHGLGVLDGGHPTAQAAAVAALGHPSAGVRRNAVQVLPSTNDSSRAILDAGLLSDADAQVRLAAFLALSELPAIPECGPAIAAAVALPKNRDDRWIPEAATSAAAANSQAFLVALAVAPTVAPQVLEVAGVVAEHYARGGPVETVGALLSQLDEAHVSLVNVIVGRLARGWPADRRPVLNAETEKDLERLLSRTTEGNRGQLIKLASRWGSVKLMKYAGKVVDELLLKVDDVKLQEEKRLDAARQLIEFQPDSTAAVEALLKRVTPQTDPQMSDGLLRVLQLSQAPQIGSQLMTHFPVLTPAIRSTAIQVLLGRKASTMALLDGAEAGSVQLDELSLDQRRTLAAHPDAAIRRRAQALLKRGGALPNADRQKVFQDLLVSAERTGDAIKGKAVFKKQCSKCHVHSGEGIRIGPDLTGMAVHPKAELLNQIVDPSRSVEGNFRLYTVVTVDGQVFNGMLASESKTAIELFDTEGKKKSLLREDIEELRGSRKSLMPDGFEKQLRPDDFSDLLEFLTQRGQYLPIDLRKAATIASDRGMFTSKAGEVERLIFPDWKPKRFKGVPFHVLDPQGGRVANVILLHGPNGAVSARMPKSARVSCNGPARAIHLLSGVSGWGHPFGNAGSLTMTVRLHFADGKTEDHELQNGVHFSDYIRRVDVPKSELAFMLRGQQVRYLAVYPTRRDPIKHIEFIKGDDRSAPVVMAVTLESP